jgi:hypothetical protein
MSDYPTLNEMGISNPEEIDRYSLQTINNIDIMRIVFKTKKGSLLPASKRFRFPRTEKLDLGDGNARDTRVYYEVPPVVRKAMVELDKIVKSKRDRAHQLEVIKEELQRLQEEAATRLNYINSLIDEISP